MNNRPHVTAIIAMTADGKIADYQNSAARFGSANDRAHLEKQVSLVDGVLFGAGTLKAYGTTMTVSNQLLIKARKERSQSSQPVQIVVSASGNLDPQWRFFQQPIPRWLITIAKNHDKWRLPAGYASQSPDEFKDKFERILIAQDYDSQIHWTSTFKQLLKLGLNKLAVLGGGELIASLLKEDLIDEFWLTICPLVFGGNSSPTPVGGSGFMQSQAKKLQLLEVKQIEQELFLHYQVR